MHLLKSERCALSQVSFLGLAIVLQSCQMSVLAEAAAGVCHVTKFLLMKFRWN